MLSDMKIFLTLLVPYAKKTIFVLKTSFFTKKGFLIIPTIAISLPVLSTKVHIGLMLAFLMLVDFITGMLVSKKEKREAEKLDATVKKENLFNSDKFKTKTGVKLFLYMSTIFITYWAEVVLKINPFQVKFSKLDFTITIVIMAIWITVELYSIIFENTKKLGFDVWEKFTSIVDLFKKSKAKIKE